MYRAKTRFYISFVVNAVDYTDELNNSNYVLVITLGTITINVLLFSTRINEVQSPPPCPAGHIYYATVSNIKTVW